MVFRATAFQTQLEEAGVDPKHARAHAAAMEEFVASELVTKEYLDARLDQLRAEFRGDIAALRSELKVDIAALRSEMEVRMAAMQVTLIRWMIGTVGGATLAIVLTLLRVAR